MLSCRSVSEISAGLGLRIVPVQRMSSPRGQGAKTIFELKGLDHTAAPWIPGDANQALVDWSAADSAPIVAWQDEAPLNRRLQMFALLVDSGQAPPDVQLMERKHRDTREDAHRAGARTADQPRALAAQVRAQYAQGRQYFIGDSLSALDIYWRSFGNLLDPLPKAQCPMPDDWRPMFVANVPQVTAALDLLLPAHRDQIFGAYFHSPMQF